MVTIISLEMSEILILYRYTYGWMSRYISLFKSIYIFQFYLQIIPYFERNKYDIIRINEKF